MRSTRLSWLAVAFASAVSAFLGTVGADTRWLAAIGGYVVRHGSIPDFVPYASAPSEGWQNVPVLAELALHGLDVAGGGRGLLVAQVAAVTLAFVLLALDIRRGGGSDSAATLVVLLLVVGTVASLAVVRSQLFSLVCFPLLIVLLREESRSPTRRIWLVPPLVALWSNLHGAVLVGVAVAAAYLLLERARREPAVSVAVLAATALAVFATPALWQSGSYYAGVLENEAARRRVGLWSGLSLSSGLDIAIVVTGLLLVVAAVRSRPALWEAVALLGLAVLSVRTARGSVWFEFLAAAPAARGISSPGPTRRVPAFAVGALAVLVVVGVVRGPNESGARSRVLRAALREAGGTPILATPVAAEQVVVAGGRVWLANPLDAFRHADQRLYLDWLDGDPAGDAALAHAPRAVLVQPDSEPQRRLDRNRAFHRVARDAGAILFVRRMFVRHRSDGTEP